MARCPALDCVRVIWNDREYKCNICDRIVSDSEVEHKCYCDGCIDGKYLYEYCTTYQNRR